MFVCVYFLLHVLTGSSGELVINVSKGTEQASVYQQHISGNLTTNSVKIQFISPQGDSVNQVTDLKNRVVITVYTVPGEQDLGQDGYQVFCFVTAYTGDLIPTEAVTKLRQKHSATVRVAEEHRGTVVQENPVSLFVVKAGVLSPHIPTLCREAKGSTYSSVAELARILKNPTRHPSIINNNIKQYQDAKRCGELSVSSPINCICSLPSCIWWFPCTLKYCRSASGEEHRCGIRTCSKCTTHRFLVENPSACIWDRN